MLHAFLLASDDFAIDNIERKLSIVQFVVRNDGLQLLKSALTLLQCTPEVLVEATVELYLIDREGIHHFDVQVIGIGIPAHGVFLAFCLPCSSVRVVHLAHSEGLDRLLEVVKLVWEESRIPEVG